MPDKKLDVIGIGNAITDVIYQCDDKIIELLGLKKGSMMSVNRSDSEIIYNYMASIKRDLMAPPIELSGGCTTTLTALASFGSKIAFNGKIDNDYFGIRFIHRLAQKGIECSTSFCKRNTGTGRSLLFNTSDFSKTLCTYLGAANNFERVDIDVELISKARILLLEGYILDSKYGKETVLKAVQCAKRYNTKIALTLNDAALVSRHRDIFMDLIDNYVSILFANKEEIQSLHKTMDHAYAVQMTTKKCKTNNMIAALTCGEEGAIILSKDYCYKVHAAKVSKVINTLGAGGLFVSGFLYGYLNGFTLPKAGMLGNIAAATVLMIPGARLNYDLSELLKVPAMQ